MLKIENLKKTYDKGSRHAHEVLHGLSFTLPDTGFVCILGHSGCGKTSLLNAIGGLDRFDSGKIITDNASIDHRAGKDMENERNATFGYIFQNYYLLTEHSAAYNVYLGMHSMNLTEKEKMRRIKDALEKVDMIRYYKRPVGELSGGQQQRVAIARAIAKRPKVIFADEPTGNLDEANTINICSILKELSKDSLVVMVTHEERIARFFADRIIKLDAGQIITDSQEWDHGMLDVGAKDTLYAGDYQESIIKNDNLTLRLLEKEGAAPINITLVNENDRIVIKVDDPRIVLSSESNSPPFIKDGKRPILNADDFERTLTAEKEESAISDKDEKTNSRGLSLKMLFNEARALTAQKKIRRFGTSIFTIILSLMLALSVADIITVASINPEDFITADSHIVGFKFSRGQQMTDKHANISVYEQKLRDVLDQTNYDFDYIPTTSSVMKYTDNTIPQYGNISLDFSGYSWVNINRLDSSTIIAGRMPERSDEVVIDRWIIDKLLDTEGVIQNIIPNREYLLGKTLKTPKLTYTLTIVGICDSNEPSMYMSTESILALGTHGTEVITLSEYKRITGDTSIDSLGRYECISISKNSNVSSTGGSSSILSFVGSDYPLRLVGYAEDVTDRTGAKMIIADEDLKPLYYSMIKKNHEFNIWSEDKGNIINLVKNDLPEEITNNLSIKIYDSYGSDYAVYKQKTSLKVDSRTIVTITVVIACAIMLYLMQRSKIKERMDLITVYRLLGIPKKNLVFIFSVESLFVTLKYATPAVLAVWIIMKSASMIKFFSSVALIFPFWAALLTLVGIAIFQLIVANAPALRLLSDPPARLAAKFDL